MSKGKKIGITIVAIFLVLCLAIDGWWLYIAVFAKEKNVSYTYNASELVAADGTKEDFITIRYYANADKSGLEMFEVDFKSFMDETREDVMSQGLQFVADEVDDELEWTINWPSGYLDRNYLGKNNWYWRVKRLLQRKRYYASFGQWGLKTGSAYNYASSNDYETTVNNNNELSTDSGFKITLQNTDGTSDIYLMQFKGESFIACGKEWPKDAKKSDGLVYLQNGGTTEYPSTDELERDNKNFAGRHKDGLNGDYTDYIDTFATYDPYWFAYDLYSSVKEKVVEYGTEQYFTFTWGDYFNYLIYDEESGVYVDAVGEEYTKVKNYVTSNITVKLEVYERGAKVASDSLFNVIHDDASFNLTGDKYYDDYFYGQNVVNLDIANFDLVQVVDNNYCLKLSDASYNFYLPYKDMVSLSICIDLDILKEQGYEFLGFTADSRLNEFKIYDCYTLETVEGETVRVEVDYA